MVHTDEMQTGCVNRSQSEEIYFGGKGINISFVLSELGITSKALGFVAGFTGKAIEEGVQKKGVEKTGKNKKRKFCKSDKCHIRY